MSSSSTDGQWSTFGITRLLMNTAAHPFEYAKFLIQIGHEPIKPFPTKTLFGKPVYGLPNIFRYLNYIYNVDGLDGCYRGLLPRLACSSVYIFAHSTLVRNYKCLNGSETAEVDEKGLTETEKRNLFLNKLGALVVCRTTAIVVSQPLHVVTLRVMAQFVGGESKYSGIFSALWTIYKEEGLSGLFSGLISRWFGEISCLIIASTVTYVFHQYFVEDKELRKFTGSSIQFITGSMMYPFQVVSSCMAVSGCGLVAGSPPQMPLYVGFFDCWRYLARQNQLKRGSSLFWRYYTPPVNNKMGLEKIH